MARLDLADDAYDAILGAVMEQPVMATQSEESQQGLASAIVASLALSGIDFDLVAPNDDPL